MVPKVPSPLPESLKIPYLVLNWEIWRQWSFFTGSLLRAKRSMHTSLLLNINKIFIYVLDQPGTVQHLYSVQQPKSSCLFIVSFFMSCWLWNLVHFLLLCYNSQWGRLCSEIGSRYPYFTTTAFCNPGNLGPLCYTQWGHHGPLSLLSSLSPWLSWHFSILALLLPLTAPSGSP